MLICVPRIVWVRVHTSACKTLKDSVPYLVLIGKYSFQQSMAGQGRLPRDQGEEGDLPCWEKEKEWKDAMAEKEQGRENSRHAT